MKLKNIEFQKKDVIWSLIYDLFHSGDVWAGRKLVGSVSSWQIEAKSS